MKIKILLLSLGVLLLSAGSVNAFSDVVAISELPEYTRTDTFNLSYSALSEGAITAQFYVMKEGGSYSAFGPVLNGASGQLQVTSGQVNDQVKYYFKVVINGGASDETSVFFDISGPSPVQNYWKERIAPETYRLHWKNPGDTDFSRTFIYRSENSDFDANNSTKIGELGGAPDDEMTYDVIGLDASKEYFFALRAVDKAGNPASLVSDQVTVIEEVEAGEGDTPLVLPSEGTGGEVLGDEATKEGDIVVDEPKTVTEKLLDVVSLDEEGSTNTWKRIRSAILTFGGVYLVWRIFFRKKRK